MDHRQSAPTSTPATSKTELATGSRSADCPARQSRSSRCTPVPAAAESGLRRRPDHGLRRPRLADSAKQRREATVRSDYRKAAADAEIHPSDHGKRSCRVASGARAAGGPALRVGLPSNELGIGSLGLRLSAEVIRTLRVSGAALRRFAWSLASSSPTGFSGDR